MARRTFDSEAELAWRHLGDTGNWDDERAKPRAGRPSTPEELASAIVPVAKPFREPFRSLAPDIGFSDEEEADTAIEAMTSIAPQPSSEAKKDRAVLLRMDGVHAGAVQTIGRAGCRIGRDASCELRVEDPSVSRVHAQLVPEGTSHIIEDLGSQNGVYVQGRRVRRAKLCDGDWIQLGPHAKFRYSLTDESEISLLRQLYESSSRDPLTGAFNRQYFTNHLESEIAFARRHDSTLSLILLDLDHFKKVNDTHGHQAGDAALRQVAKAVLQRLRGDDVFSRFGGEEFAITLRGIDLRGCSLIAERLRSTIAAVPVVFESRYIPVTVSLGCASLTCTTDRTPEQLLAVADRRLYLAKHEGRNRVIARD